MMDNDRNFRGKRMREAMNLAGMTSGQVAYKMGVTDGAVRGWTNGRRGISTDDLVKFAGIVRYPVEYFLYPEHPETRLPPDFTLSHEVARLADKVSVLVERVAERSTAYGDTEEAVLKRLQELHNLPDEAVEMMREIIQRFGKPKKQE